MIAPTRRAQRGITLIEVMIVLAIMSLIVGGAVSAFASGTEHVDQGRVLTRAESELRSNLVMLTNFMRGADITKLEGFDGSGTATEPRIKRVTGADHLGRTYDPEVTLQWRADSRPVSGVVSPGAVYAVSGSNVQLLAKRVPKDGFLVHQQGQNLVIELTTYYTTAAGSVVELSDSAVIALRNKD